MPLPPELQARLSKRGIISQKGEGDDGKVKDGETSNTQTKSSPQEYMETLLLPPDWKKVIDEKTNYPYFWNTKTREVTWHLPPGTRTISEKKPQVKVPNVQMPTVMVSKSESIEREYKEKATRPAPYKVPSKKPKRYKPSDDLDPMDPAAYSDVARSEGTWSSGLERGVEAKTGVDSTVSGPLFQMRPYPSPGAILKMNQEKTST